MIFTSVDKSAGAPSDYPPLNVPNQRVEINLHGSSGGYDTTGTGLGPAYYKGDKYFAVYPPPFTGGPLGLEFHISSGGGYGSTMPTPNPAAFVSLTPIDRVIYPDGKGKETLHSGCRHGASHGFAPLTEDAYDAMIEWAKVNVPNIDWSRSVSGGRYGSHVNNSMGAWAMLRWAMRRPQYFAFVGGSSPRFKADDVYDWETSGRLPTPAGQLMDDGSSYATAFDFVSLVNDTTKKLPFLMWTTSTGDGFTPFADCKAAIAALRARIRTVGLSNDKRSGFAVGWVPGVHGAAGPATAVLNAMNAAYPREGWKLGQGYPVVDRCSLDADPTTAGSGYVNKDVKWRNVVESASGWSCEVGATAACTVEVWPHSEVFLDQITAPVLVTIPNATTWVPVTFTGSGQPVNPIISAFTATPSTITGSQSAILTATITGASFQTIDGNPWDGQPLTVTPAATHTYTLIATGSGGTTATASATVTVSATVDPCQQFIDQRNAALAKIAAAVAILTAP